MTGVDSPTKAHQGMPGEPALSTRAFYIVDVFAQARFCGNPLAVIVGDDLTDDAMAAITREMNYSETTFVGQPDGQGRWPVRIFTPGREIPFAGHPTIGTAWLIKEHLRTSGDNTVILRLKVGDVPVVFGDDGVGWMTPPVPVLGQMEPAQAAADLLGLPVDAIDTEFPVQTVDVGIRFTLIPLRSLDAVRQASYQRHLGAVRAQKGQCPDVLLFTKESTIDAAHHIHARMFDADPRVPEDPATGSANTCLAAWINAHNYLPGHCGEVLVEQGHFMQRPSLLRLRLTPTITVGGRVVMAAQGNLFGV